MICGLAVICLILGLLCLINSAASNALFSLFVASNYLSWGMPIFCRLVWGQDRFYPGEFYTGRFSKPIACIAVIYLLFGVILSMFPTTGPNPSRMLHFHNNLRSYIIYRNGLTFLSQRLIWIIRSWSMDSSGLGAWLTIFSLLVGGLLVHAWPSTIAALPIRIMKILDRGPLAGDLRLIRRASNYLSDPRDSTDSFYAFIPKVHIPYPYMMNFPHINLLYSKFQM